jgi:MFS family permease
VTQVRLGLRENRAQFALLVLVNGFVGAVVGAERSVLPLLAESEFGVASTTAALSFLIAFGLAKAGANFLAGSLAHRVGRRRILLAGWVIGLPVPLLIALAPDWRWIVAANLLLGVNQGLAWSATVIMKIDLVGPRQRGLALGLNEFAGYVAVALAALASGYIAASRGGRAGPVWIGLGAVALGLMVTLLFVRDTAEHVELEQRLAGSALEGGPDPLPGGLRRRLWHLSWADRRLFAVNQAGFINNANDGLAWGLFPLYFAGAGLDARQIGWLAALYPAVWGITQVVTGAISDHTGRRPMIVAGMLVQAAALAAMLIAGGFGGWLVAAVFLGIGTAAVYPTLIAQASDVLPPGHRATGIGVYRLWRDLGYVAGALLAGVLTDLLGFRAAIGAVAALTAASGLIALVLLPPGRPGRGRVHPLHPPPAAPATSHPGPA